MAAHDGGDVLKILLTGCCGYLGNVTWGLLRKKHLVVGIDGLKYNQPMPEISEANLFLKVNLPNRGLYEVLEKSDVIIHTAAMVGEPLCFKYPDLARRINVDATDEIVEYAKKTDAYLIFTSTCSNYGISEDLVTEDSSLKPLGLYAETKVEAEKIVLDYDRSLVFRFGTLYGPGARPRFDILLNEWVYNAMTKHLIEIYEPEAYRPVLHVFDAASVIAKVVSNPIYGIYNYGYANVKKIALAELIANCISGTKISIISKDNLDSRNYKVDFSKGESIMGPFDCMIDTLTGISQMIKLIKSLPDPSSSMYRNEGGFIS